MTHCSSLRDSQTIPSLVCDSRVNIASEHRSSLSRLVAPLRHSVRRRRRPRRGRMSTRRCAPRPDRRACAACPHVARRTTTTPRSLGRDRRIPSRRRTTPVKRGGGTAPKATRAEDPVPRTPDAGRRRGRRTPSRPAAAGSFKDERPGPEPEATTCSSDPDLGAGGDAATSTLSMRLRRRKRRRARRTPARQTEERSRRRRPTITLSMRPRQRRRVVDAVVDAVGGSESRRAKAVCRHKRCGRESRSDELCTLPSCVSNEQCKLTCELREQRAVFTVIRLLACLPRVADTGFFAPSVGTPSHATPRHATARHATAQFLCDAQVSSPFDWQNLS